MILPATPDPLTPLIPPIPELLLPAAAELPAELPPPAVLELGSSRATAPQLSASPLPIITIARNMADCCFA